MPNKRSQTDSEPNTVWDGRNQISVKLQISDSGDYAHFAMLERGKNSTGRRVFSVGIPSMHLNVNSIPAFCHPLLSYFVYTLNPLFTVVYGALHITRD